MAWIWFGQWSRKLQNMCSFRSFGFYCFLTSILFHFLILSSYFNNFRILWILAFCLCSILSSIFIRMLDSMLRIIIFNPICPRTFFELIYVLYRSFLSLQRLYFKSPAVSVTRIEMEIISVLFQIAIWNFGLCWNLLIIASN